MDVSRQNIRIHRTERLESLEIRDRGRTTFYSYSYSYRTRHGEWKPLVRWDNFNNNPHVDKYDETGALLETKTCSEKSLDEVVKLASIFRRNLLAMDLGVL